jgi:hypothetical protein
VRIAHIRHGPTRPLVGRYKNGIVSGWNGGNVKHPLTLCDIAMVAGVPIDNHG